MTDNNELYANAERKQDLVVFLKESLDRKHAAADALDNKAFYIFSSTSVFWGIVLAVFLDKTFNELDGPQLAVLLLLFVLYVLQGFFIWCAIRPRAWLEVPNTIGTFDYDSLIDKYVTRCDEENNLHPISEDKYYNQLIGDYFGFEDDDGNFNLGASSNADEINANKYKNIIYAAMMSVLMLMGFTLLIISTFGQ